jgi:hypothetical protein
MLLSFVQSSVDVSAGRSGSGDSLYPDFSFFVPVTQYFTSTLLFFLFSGCTQRALAD